jgi:excisionase family DNA binding protein
MHRKAGIAMAQAEMLTIDEFARRTGLSRATVRRRIADRSLRAWQPGGRRTAVRLAASQIAEACVHICEEKATAPTKRRTTPRWQND